MSCQAYPASAPPRLAGMMFSDELLQPLVETAADGDRLERPKGRTESAVAPSIRCVRQGLLDHVRQAVGIDRVKTPLVQFTRQDLGVNARVRQYRAAPG